jgi:2-succinyl-5-enolpyruvyl-6-hydroxy-3-cyclohexene-1-carboxylate synthase
MNFKTLNELATSLFMEELTRQGLTDVFVAPGSRSTPLVLACAQNPKMTIYTHFDERGLGFFALGKAKKSQKPTLIITTSGTAVANLLPAVVEAYYSRTPLLICTADRPEELINVGANQAITQKNIFQEFTCENFQISSISDKTSLESLLTMAGHSFFKTTSQKCPVHINWMFQEPLVPLQSDLDNYKISEQIKNWYETKAPYTEVLFSETKASEINLDSIVQAKKILVIFGSQLEDSPSDLLKIARKLNAPVLCDVQNPLRFEKFDQNILRFDLLLDIFAWDAPDMILHFGGPLTSKKLNQYIEKFNGEYIQVQDSSQRLDFMHKRKKLIPTSVKNFSQSVSTENFNTDVTYLEDLKKKSDSIDQDLDLEFKANPKNKNLNEMSLPYHLVANVSNTDFFIGSSMPIRDLERFAGTGENQNFLFNRGASGIDGNIATAVGMALTSEKKTVCVLGDQAFLYDLNSLALLRNSKNSIHIIVINNQGGGIFSFLPVSQIDKNSFRKNFTNPHEWSFKSAAETFHLKYASVKTSEELLKTLESSDSTLIEIKTDIYTNVQEHRELTLKLKEKYE